MIYSVSNIWILQKQPRYKDLTIMLPRWYLLGYRPNSAQISNITSVWNKRKLNIIFKIPMKACFLRCCLHNMCAETHLVVHFQRPQLGFQLAGIHYHLYKDSVVFKACHMVIKQNYFNLTPLWGSNDVLTPLLVVVLGLHLSNQVARHHVGLVVLPLMVPV